jgi:hypothetical protein
VSVINTLLCGVPDANPGVANRFSVFGAVRQRQPLKRSPACHARGTSLKRGFNERMVAALPATVRSILYVLPVRGLCRRENIFSQRRHHRLEPSGHYFASAGCQPAVAGSLPATTELQKRAFGAMQSSDGFRQAAETCGAAARAPRNFRRGGVY